MSTDEIVKEYLEGLKRINPDFEESWIEAHYLHKEPAAQPIIEVNYKDRIPATKTPVERLWLASMSQVYPEDRGTNYSLRLGIRVAREAIADINAEK